MDIYVSSVKVSIAVTLGKGKEQGLRWKWATSLPLGHGYKKTF